MQNRRKPFKPIDHGKLHETRILPGLNKKEVAEMLHVTYRTWHNWESRQVQVPYAAYKLLRILTGFDLRGIAWKSRNLWGNAGGGYLQKAKKLHSGRFRLFISYFRNS